MGDAEYLYAFQKIVLPIASEFAPELVIGEEISQICVLLSSPILSFRWV
jgi:hypothetical protein